MASIPRLSACQARCSLCAGLESHGLPLLERSAICKTRGLLSDGLAPAHSSQKGAKPSNVEASRQLGLLLPELEVSEILEVFCGELAVLTRANDYSLLWASSAQASHRADLTVKDAEEACQHLIDRSVRGVFFAPFEFAPASEPWSN
jgi:hypothetical protein